MSAPHLWAKTQNQRQDKRGNLQVCKHTSMTDQISLFLVQQHDAALLFQSRVPPTFLRDSVKTNGWEKMCNLHRPQCSRCLTAANRPGWNWPKESQWPGAISPWTERDDTPTHTTPTAHAVCQDELIQLSRGCCICVWNWIVLFNYTNVILKTDR